MSSEMNSLNLKVVIVDTDFYALQSINSYLAWDRRTRVTYMSDSLDDLWEYLARTAEAELPDVVVLDTGMLDSRTLADTITRLRQIVPELKVLCLSQGVDEVLIEAAAEAGAGGFLLKQDVRFQIAWAIVYAYRYDFIVTTHVARVTKDSHHPRVYQAHTLPEQRRYPGTDSPAAPGDPAVCDRGDARPPGRRRNGDQPAHHSRLHQRGLSYPRSLRRNRVFGGYDSAGKGLHAFHRLCRRSGSAVGKQR